MQSPVRTNDLLNTVQYVTRSQDSSAFLRAFPGLVISGSPSISAVQDESRDEGTVHAPRSGFLAGDQYYTAKDQLIMDEQILLRVLRFEIGVEHAHKYLLNMCQILQSNEPLAQLATCLVRIFVTLQDCTI